MDRAELRRLAEVVIKAERLEEAEDLRCEEKGNWDDYKSFGSVKARYAFEKAANPAAIIELLDRLEAAEKVAKSAQIYLKHINSPLCIGWDDLLDALAAWQKVKEEQ